MGTRQGRDRPFSGTGGDLTHRHHLVPSSESPVLPSGRGPQWGERGVWRLRSILAVEASLTFSEPQTPNRGMGSCLLFVRARSTVAVRKTRDSRGRIGAVTGLFNTAQ